MKTYIAKSLGPGTARNWRSVGNILAIAEQIGREPSTDLERKLLAYGDYK